MRILTTISTFILFSFFVALLSYIGLIFIGFSGVLAPFPGSLGRVGFYALPLTLGIVAGFTAAWLTARTRKKCSK